MHTDTDGCIYRKFSPLSLLSGLFYGVELVLYPRALPPPGVSRLVGGSSRGNSGGIPRRRTMTKVVTPGVCTSSENQS